MECLEMDLGGSVVKKKWVKFVSKVENFHIFLTASGEGGSTQAVSLTALFPFFLLTPSLTSRINITTQEVHSTLLVGFRLL